jgi:hypothetical protein
MMQPDDREPLELVSGIKEWVAWVRYRDFHRQGNRCFTQYSQPLGERQKNYQKWPFKLLAQMERAIWVNTHIISLSCPSIESLTCDTTRLDVCW